MTFTEWLDTFTTEKNLNVEQVFTVQGATGANHIPLGCVIEAIKSAPVREQNAIKDVLVIIDFHHGDVCRYFAHLAQAIAI
jgi:hypothetical protein